MRMAVVMVRGAWYAVSGVLLAAGAAGAQVPTFQEVTGHAFGERITQHHEMVRYLERLAATSDRVRVERLGRSWEGREFLVAIVTAPENHRRLEAIRETARRLYDPRGVSEAEATAALAGQPALVWFGGSIHGFELSGSEGALKLLEHLTTRNDPATLEALRATVVMIDPMLNPDGRDAFAALNHRRIGARPTGNPDDWSNDFTSWDGLDFRTGHYFFDNNRDWFAHTQPAARDRVAFALRWPAQAAVDMHEMGANAEFYFDPPAEPTSPFFPAFASRWFRTFGDAYAAAFDSAGYEYMRGERYNYFYPGYTSSRAYAGGAVAMLFEQGSSRGLALDRGDGSIRRLRDALEQQYLAAWTTVRTAARERERLLREYLASQRETVAPVRDGVRRFVIDPTAGDPGLVRELVALLGRNGISVDRLTAETRFTGLTDRTGAPVADRTFGAGSYVVEVAQPARRMLLPLLLPDTPIPGTFLREARARVERAENPRFYDITAWSLPLLFNLHVYGSTDGRPLQTVAGAADTAAPAAAGEAGYAWLLDGRNAATAAALWHLRDQGYRVAFLTAETRNGPAVVPAGTGIVRVGQNDGGVHEAVRSLAARYGILATRAASGHAQPGYPALGSGDHTFNLRPARVAVLAEDGIAGYSFGWAWYTLDRQYGIPVTVLRTRSLAGTDLAQYEVLVIPNASGAGLRDALGEAGLERLAQWVRDGGTLVGIEGGADFARGQFDLAVRDWYDTDAGKDAQRFEVPGAVFRARVDTLQWMAAGVPRGDLPVLVTGSRLWLAPDGPPSSRRRVVARYAEASPRLAGHAWPESLERLPGAVAVYEERVGGGRVILFAEDPNFRGYHRGMNRLFLNAVVVGPSAP